MDVKVSKTTIIGLPQYSVTVEDVTVTLDTPGVDYGHCVNKLITAKYPADKMQAVVNNYLLASESVEYKAEWEEMQAWRMKAKEASMKAVEIYANEI